MDKVKAKELEKQLSGKTIKGWSIKRFINNGKSAAVFEATKGSEIAAVKIFDDELIKRYGDETQFSRIERELTLVGKHHPNMVKIIEGGFDDITQNHYIIMEYIDGKNIAECLEDIPYDRISTFISQLASAAKFLESLGLCHRDIKPENVAVSTDFSKVVLLDFGVLRPIGVAGLTDGDEIQQFVGTLQYSSPEFLLRKEEDSVNGWRALTFYQIGGVLHDLIMRKSLFEDFANPYAVLVNAVQHEQPKIQNSEVTQNLINLAGKCLLKDWKVRLSLLNWTDFLERSDKSVPLTSAKQRVANRSALLSAQSHQSASKTPLVPRKADIIAKAIDHLKVSVRAIRSENTLLPRAQVTRNPPSGEKLVISYEASQSMGLNCPLEVTVSVEVVEAISYAVRLTATAFLGSDPHNHSAPEQETELFSGVFNAAGVRETLEEYIYLAIDAAQDRALSSAAWLHISLESVN